MPNWSTIFQEVHKSQKPVATLEEKQQTYLNEVFSITGRNVISYYSAWLKQASLPNVSIDEHDKNAFMNAVCGLDRSKGLDLILHTPGGDVAATESIVVYLKKLFKNDVRAIIPQISMSAGTMIALSCKEIIMGDQSSLGPIDPQLGGVPCQGVVSEFKRAVREVKRNPSALGLWQTIISKYHPTFLTECENATKWSEELAQKWLQESNPQANMRKIKSVFLTHQKSYSHARRLSKEKCKETGLKIVDLEANQKLQEAILSLHHCYMILFDIAPISKIVENQNASRYIQKYTLQA